MSIFNKKEDKRWRKKVGILKCWVSHEDNTVIEKDENGEPFYCTNCNRYTKGIKLKHRWIFEQGIGAFGVLMIIGGIYFVVMTTIPLWPPFLLGIGIPLLIFGLIFIASIIAAKIYVFKKTKSEIICKECELELNGNIDYQDKTHKRNLHYKKDESVVENYYGTFAKAKAIKDVQDSDIEIEKLIEKELSIGTDKAIQTDLISEKETKISGTKSTSKNKNQ